MNPKIKAIDKDIEKTRSKIAEFQAHLKEQERRRIELENTDIISLVRGMNIDPDAFERFMRTYTEQSGKTPVPNNFNTTEENADEDDA